MFHVVSFCDINISQGSVATRSRCGRTFNRFARNLLLKEFTAKSVSEWILKIGRSASDRGRGKNIVAPFFRTRYRTFSRHLMMASDSKLLWQLSENISLRWWIRLNEGVRPVLQKNEATVAIHTSTAGLSGFCRPQLSIYRDCSGA